MHRTVGRLLRASSGYPLWKWFTIRSTLMAVVNQTLGVKATNCSAYRPRTNGQLERSNSTLCMAITHYAATQNASDLELETATCACNRTPNQATDFAPFELVLSPAPVP
jgi:hypothetical protein